LAGRQAGALLRGLLRGLLLAALLVLGTVPQVDAAADISGHATGALAVKLVGVSKGGGYVLGARLVRRQGLQRIKQLMTHPPSLREALQQLKQKVRAGGGSACALQGC
jgi:hypothetical protein